MTDCQTSLVPGSPQAGKATTTLHGSRSTAPRGTGSRRRVQRRVSVAFVGLLVGAVGACAGDAATPAAPTPASPPTTASAEAPPPDIAPQPDAAETDANEAAVVRIERSRFEPQHITVGVGQPVTFVNDDPFAHTATARPDSDIAFDSGALAEGMQFVVEFDRPGTHAYFCAIHPTMRGTIVVG